jgi:hypothetical protein
MFGNSCHGVGNVGLVDAIRSLDLRDFLPNLFNPQCCLPFVHRSPCPLLAREGGTESLLGILVRSQPQCGVGTPGFKEAYNGRLRKARELLRRAVESAKQNGAVDTGG